MRDWIPVVVALISAMGVAGGPIAVVLIQKARKEQADFRVENDLQHGRSMEMLRDIQMTALETRIDLRELRQDFEEHLDDHSYGQQDA